MKKTWKKFKKYRESFTDSGLNLCYDFSCRLVKYNIPNKVKVEKLLIFIKIFLTTNKINLICPYQEGVIVECLLVIDQLQNVPRPTVLYNHLNSFVPTDDFKIRTST